MIIGTQFTLYSTMDIIQFLYTIKSKVSFNHFPPDSRYLEQKICVNYVLCDLVSSKAKDLVFYNDVYFQFF